MNSTMEILNWGGQYAAQPKRVTDSGQSDVFIWTADLGMRNIGRQTGPYGWSEPKSASSHGNEVVGWSAKPGGLDAFLWTRSNGFRTLMDVLIQDYGLRRELAGWSLTCAEGISPEGNAIVGWGRNPRGEDEGFLVRRA